MARLRNANPRNISGAYERLFGDPELGALASKIQSAVISSGNELERMIVDIVPNVTDLDDFLHQKTIKKGVWLATKQQMKKCQTLHFSGTEPDFMVFKKRGDTQRCYIIELKDGHVFDTKKVSAERQTFRRFAQLVRQHVEYKVSVHFCAFNQETKEAILAGFKNKIAPKEAMTGRKFCKLLEIDHSQIVEERMAHASDNVEFLLTELTKIEQARSRLVELLEIE